MGIFDGLWATSATLSPLETATMAAVVAAEDARRSAQAAAWDAYHADWPDPLPPAADGVDDAITVNRLRTVVDTATDFLFGTLPAWNLPPRADAGASAPAAPEIETDDEVWLKECLRVNDLPRFLLDLRAMGGVTGDGYVRLTPPDPATDQEYPGFDLQDTSCMTMRWNPRNIRDIQGYTWQATVPGPDGKPRLERQRTVRDGTQWRVFDEHAPLRGWDRWVEDAQTVWPYAFAPILHVPNLPIPNEVYGGPDITANLIRLNRNLNTNLTNRNRVERYQGHPILYATGVGPQTQLDIRPDKLNKLPGEHARLDQLAPKLDMAAAQQLAKEINDALDEEARTPALTRGRSDLGNLSGVALTVQFWPMDAKIRALRLTYGPFLVELCRRLLALAGRGPNRIITLSWPRILPQNYLEHRQGLAIEATLGTTSRATLAGDLGRDWATEQQNLQDEAALAPPPGAPPVSAAAPTGPTGVPMPMGTGDGESDQQFLIQMIAHHQAAVDMAAAAAPTTRHPELRALEATIQQTQTAEIEKMRAWLQQWYGAGATMPMGAPMPMGTGGESDQQFLIQMIAHHQAALDMVVAAAPTTRHPELRALEATIQQTQTAEIAQMRAWLQQWYGGTAPPRPDPAPMGDHLTKD